MFHDEVKQCKNCEACQKSAGSRPSDKAKLVPMAIVNVPFRKAAIHMDGSVTRTKRGNKYTVVLVDYATQSPEAMPVATLTYTVSLRSC